VSTGEGRYTVEFSPGAAKALRKMRASAPQQARRILEAVADLAGDPRPAGKKVKALVGRQGHLRLRVGEYRVVYEVLDQRLVVLVVQIGHRREVYDR
jgi:mRNA interferase RelE/StbE